MLLCTGRVYPSNVVCVAGDRRLGSAEYAEGNEDEEYPVVGDAGQPAVEPSFASTMLV